MAGKVVHFEIPIDDNERGTRFYSTVFGWDLQQFGPMEYWTTTAGEGDGSGGALASRANTPAPIFYIAVDDVDTTLAAVEAAGGQKLSERMPVPGMGWMAFFADSEGNRLGVFQEDPTAPIPS